MRALGGGLSLESLKGRCNRSQRFWSFSVARAVYREMLNTQLLVDEIGDKEGKRREPDLFAGRRYQDTA